MSTIAATIEGGVSQWPGVTVGPHRFGGWEFRVNGREIGHLHGDRLADILFPVRIRKELVAAGKASLHHVLPDTGWISYHIQGEHDIPAVIDLFRLSYERLTRPKLATAVLDRLSGEGRDR
jgi:hypothetical protein